MFYFHLLLNFLLIAIGDTLLLSDATRSQISQSYFVSEMLYLRNIKHFPC